MKSLETRRVWCLVIVLLAATAAAQADTTTVCGRLEEVNGIRVLTLWGSDYERGYAHGYLLAEQIVEFSGKVVLDAQVLKSKQVYEKQILKGVLPRMNFHEYHERELEGMFAGVQARVGEKGLYQKELERPLTLKDLKALNALPDWYAFFCSSFSVWGDLHEKGQIATARNLDFIPLPGLVDQQLLIVHLPSDSKRKKWVSISWCGMIGCFTGMNEDGVTISIHDCRPGARSNRAGFVPRTLALRQAIETASAESALDQVEEILRKSPSFFGNNIHVSCPFTGQETPAAIFEYDSNGKLDGGVSRRTAEHNGDQLPPNALLCTNHHRLRSSPPQCVRFEGLRNRLAETVDSQLTIDQASAFDIMKQIANWGHVLTAHTVYMLPNTGELYLSLASAEQGAPTAHIAHFKIAELFHQNK